MLTPPPLPTRVKKNIPSIVQKTIRLSDITEIEDYTSYHILISMNDTVFNHDLFNKLLKDDNTVLEFLDYESIKYIDSMLTDKISNYVVLVDDGLLRDRSYIDMTSIKNMNVVLPINYLLWGPKLGNRTRIYEYRFNNENYSYYSNQDNNFISSDTLKKIRDLAIRIERLNPKTDVEKIYMVSDYIQSTVQYIDGIESESSKGIIVCPDIDMYYREQHYIDTPINRGFGVCGPISHLTTLLLNNEMMGVEIETLRSSSHFYNRVLIDGKYYYVDNTWNITRSEKSPSDALITNSFNNDYLLFGIDRAKRIGHHDTYVVFNYTHGEDSKED